MFEQKIDFEPIIGRAYHIGVILHDFRLGGSERIALRLAREWAAQGCRVTLFVGEDDGPMRSLAGDRVNIQVADRSVSWRGRDIRRLSRWATQAAIHSRVTAMFVPGNTYFRSIPVLEQSGISTISALTNPIVRYDRSAVRNLAFRAVTAWRLRNVGKFVTPCEEQADEIRSQLGQHVPLAVIPNPVLDSLPDVQDILKVAGQICAVGRLEPQKNIALLLRAFALLHDLPLTLKIAGEGSLKAELIALAQQLGLSDRVEFLGMVQETIPLMAQSQHIVISSDFEGYPAVCVEALAAGCYVIARDCSSGMQAMLSAPNVGTLVSTGTPEALADAIREVMQGARFNAEAARELAVKSLLGPVARSYLELFAEVVEEKV